MARLGKGRRTRQYNPGAKSLGAYVAAVTKHKRGRHDAGGKIIHETPAHKRSEYARQIWALRRRYNPQYKVFYGPTAVARKAYEAIKREGIPVDRFDEYKGQQLVFVPSRPYDPWDKAQLHEKAMAILRRQGITGNLHNPIYVGNPETVRIGGIEYEILDRKTVEEHEAEGLSNLAREMRKYKIAASLTLARQRGDSVFQVYEYVNGRFGRLGSSITGVSAKEYRKGNPRHVVFYGPSPEAHKAHAEIRKGGISGVLHAPTREGFQVLSVSSEQDSRIAKGVLRRKGFETERGHVLNPIIEAVLGGAAAGAAVIGSQEVIKKIRERKGKGMWPFSRSKQSNGSKAALLYRNFHGRSASQLLRMNEALMASGTYVALGDDPELWLRKVPGRDPENWPEPDISMDPSDQVKIVTDPEGRQFYFVGVNQRLPGEYIDVLARDGADVGKRFLDVGEVYALSYKTEKKFDAFETIPYAHRFGEDNGKRPMLVYDQQAEKLLLVGGAYAIAPYDAHLGASPGVVN